SKEIDTRGRLLQEYVRLSIAHTQQQPLWRNSTPTEGDVLHLLSQVACAARWTNDRNAIQLPVSTTSSSKINFEELAGELQYWLNEYPPAGPFATNEGFKSLY